MLLMYIRMGILRGFLCLLSFLLLTVGPANCTSVLKTVELGLGWYDSSLATSVELQYAFSGPTVDEFDFCFNNRGNLGSDSCPLLVDRIFTLSDIGTTIRIDASDAVFAPIVSLLQQPSGYGDIQEVIDSNGAGVGSGEYPSSPISGSIQYLVFTLDSLCFSTNGTCLPGSGFLVDNEVQMAVTVYGTPVPEPVTSALFWIGTAAVLFSASRCYFRELRDITRPSVKSECAKKSRVFA